MINQSKTNRLKNRIVYDDCRYLTEKHCRKLCFFINQSPNISSHFADITELQNIFRMSFYMTNSTSNTAWKDLRAAQMTTSEFVMNFFTHWWILLKPPRNGIKRINKKKKQIEKRFFGKEKKNKKNKSKGVQWKYLYTNATKSPHCSTWYWPSCDQIKSSRWRRGFTWVFKQPYLWQQPSKKPFWNICDSFPSVTLWPDHRDSECLDRRPGFVTIVFLRLDACD